MAETKPKRSLSDSDIATFQRRAGPTGGTAATDVDADAHAHTDSDAAPKAATDADADAAPATDRDR